MGRTILQRRSFLRGAVGGAGLLALGGCAAAARSDGQPALAFYDRPPPLAPIRPHADRIFRITVCARPFRAQGPRLEVEQVAGKRVVHNYGHGGSGWSLSWGSGTVATKMALETGERDVAVLGCGALGLTTALIAQRAGANVTIYAKERLPQSRSARATGTWSPDSRIALASAAGPGFPALWEEMCRTSFAHFQTLLGLPGAPVEWIDRYLLTDLSPEQMRAARRLAPETISFARYEDQVRDLTPRQQWLPADAHPFPVPYVRRASTMIFNIAEYGRLLERDFLLAGGRIEIREFHSPSELSGLNQKVVINCTGYGARALWKDETLTPVRGQIAWLIPQPEVNYGLQYRDVAMYGRRDGIVIQQTGATEAWGYGDASEVPDRAEAESALAVYRDLYSRMR